MKIEEEFITTSEMQAQISEVIRSVEDGKRYVILRYSKPGAVIISFRDYREMVRLAKLAKGGACRLCQL